MLQKRRMEHFRAKVVLSEINGKAVFLGFVSRSRRRNCKFATLPTVALYNEWPGPQEVRAVFCSRFKPADSIEAYSSVYMDGIPSESETYGQIEAPCERTRISTADVSADPEMRQAIVKLVTTTKLK